MAMSIEACAKHCLDCYQACTSTFNVHCLQRGGDHLARAHVTLMQDCAEMCRLSANYLLRHSPLHHAACHICAEICQQCADDCDEFSDEGMKSCARSCYACADACRKISGAFLRQAQAHAVEG